jgi:hypothetical protein
VVSRPWHEIWRGNNQLFVGSYYRIRNVEQESVLYASDTLHNRALMARLDSLPYNQDFEVRADSIFKEEAIAYIVQNPVQTAAMTALKASQIWTIDGFYSKTRQLGYILCVLPWSLCAVLGFGTLWRSSVRTRDFRVIAPLICLSAIAAYYTAVFGLTFFVVRYQIYFISLLTPVAGIGAWLFVNRFNSRFKSHFTGRAEDRK